MRAHLRSARPTREWAMRRPALLPRLAAEMRRLAILRAVTHRDGAHEPGVATMQTGYSFRPGHNFPALGAVVGFERQQQVQAEGLPPYVGIPDGRGGGHLGPSWNAFS